RGTYESDWALPRYAEDPAPLLGVLQAHVHAPDCPSPQAIQVRQTREAAATWAALRDRLRWWQKPFLVPILHWLVRKTRNAYQVRERYRFEMVRLMAELRRWHLALAERFVRRSWLAHRDEYFFLEWEEIGPAIADPARAADFTALVARRKAERDQWRHLA